MNPAIVLAVEVGALGFLAGVGVACALLASYVRHAMERKRGDQ